MISSRCNVGPRCCSLVLSLLWLAVSTYAGAADVHSAVPASVDSKRQYVFYLHGRIVENSGPRPVSTEYGVYDYPGILEALSSTGAAVISAQRPPDTDVRAYAGVIVSQIERLIASGASPERITVVGFSKGGAIALHVSSFLRRPEVTYVIQAACGDWLSTAPNLLPTGHVLSLMEKSDTLAGSCSSLRDRRPGAERFKEIQIATGRGHGAFFVPRDEWLNPTLEWISED